MVVKFWVTGSSGVVWSSLVLTLIHLHQELLVPRALLTHCRGELPWPAWAAQQRREDEDGFVWGEG